MDLYFSWAPFFQAFTKRFKWAAEVLQFNMVPVNLKRTAFSISWGVILPNERAAVQMSCSQTGFTVVLLVSQKLAGFPSLEGVVLVLDESQLVQMCTAADFFFTLHSNPGMGWSHHTFSACTTELCLCVNPGHKNPSLFFCGIFSSEMKENQIAFRITLMKKTKKQLNFCPRLVRMFSNWSCPMILLSIRMTFLYEYIGICAAQTSSSHSTQVTVLESNIAATLVRRNLWTIKS